MGPFDISVLVFVVSILTALVVRAFGFDLTPQGIQDSAWRVRVVSALSKQLDKTHESMELERLHGIVNYVWEAMPENPSLDKDRKAATLKFLVAIYGESRFNEKAKHKNSNGTWDRGIAQVNDVNAYLWGQFCHKHHIGQTEKNFWRPAFNIRFGAWINERQYRAHGAVYRWDRSVSQRRLYAALRKVAP